MSWVLIGVAITIMALFILLGWAVRYRKAYWLISGYNMMSDEQKSRVDVEGLSVMIFRWLLAGGVLIAAAFLLLAFNLFWPGLGVFLLIFPWIITMLVRAQRYDGNSVDANGRWNTKTRWIVGGLAALLLGVGCFVAWAIYHGDQPVVYSMADGKLTITCDFGTTIKLADIADLQLLPALPAVARRDYGSDTDAHLKGNFTLKDGGGAHIYARSDATAVIQLKTSKGKIYLLTAETAEETRQLYQKVSAMKNDK